MSPTTPDPYLILGVPKDAQIAEIRSAHRKLVLKCHPDKVQDPELKAQKQDEFQKVQQAYEILSDEKERKRYDDTVQLAELRRQMQNKANISVSRSSPKYQDFEIRTAEPSTSYKAASSHVPPNVKVYTASYSRSWEDDRRTGSRYHDGTETARSSRRETSYSDRPSKRDAEKERDRERERERERKDEKEKERERERRKRKEKERDEELRRQQEKEEKKLREKEKKSREKIRSKEMKRDTEHKRRDPESPYIETWDEDPYASKSEKKKSSTSRKHDEKRERSSHRDDPPSVPRYPTDEPTKIDHARAYIQQSQRGGPERSHSYHHLRSMPAVPTPPPADNPTFLPPEEEIRRSSARPRPSSGEAPALSREKSSYRSRERLDRDREEPIIVSASPTSRHPFPPPMSSSPPHISPVHRTNTMPSASASTARPIPPVSRSNTFSGVVEGGESPVNKGRNRSRRHPQVHEEEYDDDYDRRPVEKERKHRSSKKHRSPERGMETRYHVADGRAKLYHTASYSRKLPMDQESFHYDYEQPASGSSRAADPSMAARDAYSGSSYRVKQSRTYGASDVQYSTYPAAQTYREGYPAVYA